MENITSSENLIKNAMKFVYGYRKGRVTKDELLQTDSNMNKGINSRIGSIQEALSE